MFTRGPLEGMVDLTGNELEQRSNMKEVMKHLTDDSLELHLVRYHNTQAWDKLRDISGYVQMLLARIENPESKRVIAAEMDVIVEDAQSAVAHLRNAEMFAKKIAQDHSRAVVNQTITETEHMVSGDVTTMGVVGSSRKKMTQ